MVDTDSTASRVIGFDGPKTCWVLNESKPFCVSTDKIRPATPAETLAYLYLNKQDTTHVIGPDDDQQNFVDYRADSDGSSNHENASQHSGHDESDIPPSPLEDDDDSDAEMTDPPPRAEREVESDRGTQPDGELSPELGSDMDFEPEELRVDNPTPPRGTPRLREELDDFPTAALRVHRRRMNSEDAEMQTAGVADDGNSLLSHMRRTGVTGPGVELLSRADEEREAFCAFMAERIPMPATSKNNKNAKKQAAGKTFRYNKPGSSNSPSCWTVLPEGLLGLQN